MVIRESVKNGKWNFKKKVGGGGVRSVTKTTNEIMSFESFALIHLFRLVKLCCCAVRLACFSMTAQIRVRRFLFQHN